METAASGSSALMQRISCKPCSVSHVRARFAGQQLCLHHRPQQTLDRRTSSAVPCRASMGIGFQPETPSTSGSEADSRIVIPKSAYGLSTRQIAALGISDPDVAQLVGPRDPVRASQACFSVHIPVLGFHVPCPHVGLVCDRYRPW